MESSLFFVSGLLLGAASMYCFFNRLTKMLMILDKKYDRLIQIVSHWQKKI